jgi:hypothetical protein
VGFVWELGGKTHPKTPGPSRPRPSSRIVSRPCAAFKAGRWGPPWAVLGFEFWGPPSPPPLEPSRRSRSPPPKGDGALAAPARGVAAGAHWMVPLRRLRRLVVSVRCPLQCAGGLGTWLLGGGVAGPGYAGGPAISGSASKFAEGT